MGKFLYNIFLSFYSLGARITSLWNPKAKLWVNGRKDIFAKIKNQLQTPSPVRSNHPGGHKLVWMHCASLGEFEQGRPLLEELKIKNSALKIVLTFFSPSGYEVMKDYKGADHVFYLPMDSAVNARRFIDAIDPSFVLWVKYEYWIYYLLELKKRNIPTMLVSGIFRKSQPFFGWFRKMWTEVLGTFTHFFVQNAESKELLASIGFNENVSINGDTRFDRVLEIANDFKPVPFIPEFCGDSQVIVAGSTWEEDEIELLHFVKVHPHIKFIIAPHEIDEENLNDVKKEFPNSIFYSALDSTANDKPQTNNVLIIDNIGMLSRLYKYGTINYVGGGFGDDGVHNVLEAAVYGKPVVFGPVYEKFDEAIGLIEEGGGISVGGPIKLEEVFNKLLNNETDRRTRGEAAGKYVHSNEGASQKITRFIQENRLLTN